MVLHRLQDVVVPHPGPGLAAPLLARLGPDLVKARHYEGSPGTHLLQLDIFALGYIFHMSKHNCQELDLINLFMVNMITNLVIIYSYIHHK